MLHNLRVELVKQKLKPIPAIMEALGCSESTARNKLNGNTDITLPEAVKLVDAYFTDSDIALKVLFAQDSA